jgi:hypothetical protein
MTSFDAPLKDPDSTLFYSMDWRDWLAEGESITSQTVTASPNTMTISAVLEADGIVTWRAEGGNLGEDYTVTVRITTDAGQTEDRSIRYRIRQL